MMSLLRAPSSEKLLWYALEWERGEDCCSVPDDGNAFELAVGELGGGASSSPDRLPPEHERLEKRAKKSRNS